MNFNHFLSHLYAKCDKIMSFEDQLRKMVIEVEVNKGQVLLYPGELCKYVYYIHSGFFRLYQLIDNEEATVGFAGPTEFTTVVESFFKQNKGNVGLICEIKAVIFKISYRNWLLLEELSPLFILLSKNILQEYLHAVYVEKNVYRTSNATQKYLYLLTRYPQLSNMICQKHIASYLGITEQSMSLIRKSLLRAS